MFGFLNIDKPSGPTSHDIVARIRKLAPPRTKVGHTGTLDPFATGVLVVCVGPATRLAEYVQRTPKRYTAEITLSATSTTDDPEGEISEAPPPENPPSPDELRRVVCRYVGRIQQTPPAHSAVHVDGQRAYRIARTGEPVRLASREVVIYEIDVLSYEYPHLSIDVRCGPGTYIRALGRDIGADLGVGGYCSKLMRTGVGPFRIGGAIPIDELDPARDLLDPLTALDDLPRVVAGPDQARRLANGNPIELSVDINGPEAAVVDEDARLLAIAAVDGEKHTLNPAKVFVPPVE